MDRRHFILCAAAGALAAGLPGAAWSTGALTGPSGNLQTLARPALLDMFGARRVRGLGVQYCARYPAECDADILAAAIRGSEALARADASMSPAFLEATIRDDFAAGRTVLLEGWVLSVTEARQCALFSLVYP